MSGWSWMALAGLALAVAILTLIVADVVRVVRELGYINAHDTNANVTAATRWPLVRQLTAAINANLAETRRLRAHRVQQDAQVHALLTNLTHDIKTPLTVASGYVQLMQKQAPDDQQLLRIGHNLTAVDYYLRYLMTFNLSQEQHQLLNLESLDLSALVQEQLFDAFDQLNARGLTLTPHLAPGVMLVSDRTRVVRVLQNLIGNWLKYAVDAVAVDLREKDPTHIELVLANRCREPIADVDQLLARFYTGDPARQDSTGLGLSIVASLMTQLNGTLSLEAPDDRFVATLVFRRSV